MSAPDHPAPRRVRDALRSAGSDAEVLWLDESARTARLAAEALGTTPACIAKSLVFMAGDEPVLVVASGGNRVSEDKLATLLGRPVRQATADEVRQATGYAIGGVPPLGHDRPLRTLLDRDILGFERMWAAAGHPRSVFPTSGPELARLTGGEPADLKEAP